jgi:hypothetical protein
MRNSTRSSLSLALLATSLCSFAQAPTPQTGLAPDVLGLRPGMPIGDAYRLLKAHDPRGSIRYGQKRIAAVSDKPITHALLYSANGSSQDPEIIIVDATFPPGPQTVWRVTRFVQFAEGKRPLASTVLDALRQKYGQELPNRTPQLYSWVFDQQGRPLRSAPGVDLNDCAYFVERPNVQSYMDMEGRVEILQNVPPGPALYPANVVANRDACHAYIYVGATVAEQGVQNHELNSVSVSITDIGRAIRAGVATNAVMNRAAEQQQQRELNKAKQQAAPSF